MLSDGRITSGKHLKRKPRRRQTENTERKHRNDTKKQPNRTIKFSLLRISYGDEHWRSGTPGIEATVRNDRTSSKPNSKGCILYSFAWNSSDQGLKCAGTAYWHFWEKLETVPALLSRLKVCRYHTHRHWLLH